MDRKRKFNSSIIPKAEKIDPRIKEDLAALHLAGISKRTMEMISKRIFGVDILRETVSNSLALIEDKALSWLQRAITKKYWALYIDGSNFKIQRRGSVEKEIALAALGVDENNRKSILYIFSKLVTWRYPYRAYSLAISIILSRSFSFSGFSMGS